MESWKCDVCEKSFSGIVCFKQHEASEKHKKKMGLMNFGAYDSPSPVKSPHSTSQLYCSICKVFISGLDNYQKHVNSLEHAIMVQKKNNDLLSHAVSGTFELKTENNHLAQSALSLTGPTNTVAAFAACKPCQKRFSGPEPYQQHLASAGHKKKCGPLAQIMQVDETDSVVGKNNISDNLPCDSQSPVSVSPLAEPVKAVASFAECKPCQKHFSGPEPYQQHLASAGHKKKCGPLAKIMQIDEIDSIIRKDDSNVNRPYDLQSSVPASTLNDPAFQYLKECNICEMQFSGALPYQMHMISDCHKKRASEQILENSFSEHQSAFKCDICTMTFTGPEPYRQHLVSNGHAKKVNCLSQQLAAAGSVSPQDSTLKNNDPQKFYCVTCKKQCSGPIPYNTHISGREHSKNLRILQVEENLRKVKAAGPLPYMEYNEKDSTLCNEVSSTADLYSGFESEMIKEIYSDSKMNNLNINIKKDETKILSDKFETMADLSALHILNIIPLEKLDVTVIQSEGEIVFRSPRKCR